VSGEVEGVRAGFEGDRFGDGWFGGREADAEDAVGKELSGKGQGQSGAVGWFEAQV